MTKKEQLLKLKATLVAMSILAGGTAIGCGEKMYLKDNDAKKEEIVEHDELVDEIMGGVNSGDIKVFETGEHYISVRIQDKYAGSDANGIPGLAISNIPEGYEIYQIVPFNTKSGAGSRCGGYDVWFVNTEPVKVEATFNEYYNTYGYFTFGTVVEKELIK